MATRNTFRETFTLAALSVVVCVLLATTRAVADDAANRTQGERLFAIHVQPLLAAKCFACHGGDAEEIQGELNLTSRAGMLKGGATSRKVLVPGDGAASLLYEATTWKNSDLQMPPKENDRLTEEQTWLIRDWINAGAPWPDGEKIAALRAAHEKEQAEGVVVHTSGGLSEEWTNRRYRPENLWAYQPLEKPPVPVGFGGANSVDAFINRRLKELQLSPAPRADRRMLIRRATYDLLGLPPTPDEIAEFLEDPDDDRAAFGKLVDRLLASPHYGEQWARHWLDVVRYADTAGFANDFERPNAWRYRDYVIRSFNQDKPYDRFVREQIAGDEIDPADPEILIAVGFLRMGPWEQTGMSVAKITRQQFLDDVTDSVGQVFLSHPLGCCRCHDHKFDPLPTRDYYRIQAVFATTQFTERDAAWLTEENTSGFEQEQRYLETAIRRYEAILKRIQQKEEQAARQWYAERGLKYAPRDQLLKQGVPEDQVAPRHIGLTTEDFGIERICRKNLVRHRWELDRFRPIAFSVFSGKTPSLRAVSNRLAMPKNPTSVGTLESTAILAGGDPFSPTQSVSPGVLSCAVDADADSVLLPDEIAGRRRALAEWIASPENPLTARSIVNRVWQYHFGQGVARNANNFGAMGKKPTHPDLLDWLTGTFIEHGWSLKQLHRLIMTSDSYCRSSQHPDIERALSNDPERVSYAAFVPRRLSAEELRDSLLAVSGELNRAMGGIPIRPDMNLEAALQPRQIMGTYAPAYQPSPWPEQRNRRSIYAVRIRGQRDPFLEVFNQPSPEKSCELRDASTVTPQVFTLFNSEESADRALAMAARLLRETVSQPQAVRRAFALAFGREPDDEELRDCLSHWQEMTRRHETLTFEPQPLPKEVVRHAIEEMNGEPFTFTEKLDVYDDYVPDLKPWDADPQTRALADVCLVLMNANEFLYVP